MGLLWTPEAENGSPILDYTVSRAVEDGAYSILAISNTQSFIVFGLSPGVTYRFKVQARNIFGISEYSTELELLSAFVP